jgi:hypothetical protein
MTVTDFDSGEPNALVAMELDTAGFWSLVLETYARVAAAR